MTRTKSSDPVRDSREEVSIAEGTCFLFLWNLKKNCSLSCLETSCIVKGVFCLYTTILYSVAQVCVICNAYIQNA